MRRDSNHRGFSLVEMLLAVFILGIGVISIAALFPAGIALQRQANDDTVGPIVAKNAFAAIRAKLTQDDFGSFQDFGLAPDYTGVIAGTFRTVGGTLPTAIDLPQQGDWCWMRPGFLFNPDDAGTIDVFSAGYTRQNLDSPMQPFPPTTQKATEMPDGVAFSSTGKLFGIPYNPRKYPLFTDVPFYQQTSYLTQRVNEPLVTFTQSERAWPQAGANYGASVVGSGAQFYWDCMFRRLGGRVQVAVFVYRVTPPGGEPRGYTVQRADPNTLGTPPSGTMDTTIFTPPVPLAFYAPTPGGTTAWPNRAGTAFDEIPGTGPATPFGAGKSWDDWMAPAQVWVDNHGNVHHVLRGRLVAGSAAGAFPNQGPVKLQRQIPIMPRNPVYGAWADDPRQGGFQTTPAFNAHIGAIWFVPNNDKAGNVITPVYAAVEEL